MAKGPADLLLVQVASTDGRGVIRETDSANRPHAHVLPFAFSQTTLQALWLTIFNPGLRE